MHHKAGVMKQFKRASNKKSRRTPITSQAIDMQYSEQTVKIKLPKNIVRGSLPTEREIEITITVKTPSFIDVENSPRGLDIWEID